VLGPCVERNTAARNTAARNTAGCLFHTLRPILCPARAVSVRVVVFTRAVACFPSGTPREGRPAVACPRPASWKPCPRLSVRVPPHEWTPLCAFATNWHGPTLSIAPHLTHRTKAGAEDICGRKTAITRRPGRRLAAETARPIPPTSRLLPREASDARLQPVAVHPGRGPSPEHSGSGGIHRLQATCPPPMRERGRCACGIGSALHRGRPCGRLVHPLIPYPLPPCPTP